MNKLRGLAILMGLVMLVITGFQIYWLKDNYRRESTTLTTKTNILFRETVRDLQDSLLQHKLQVALKDTTAGKRFHTTRPMDRISTATRRGPGTARIISLLGQQVKNDSLRKKGTRGVFISVNGKADFQGKDSTGKLRFVLDSLQQGIQEMVVVKAKNRPSIAALDSMALRSGSRRNSVMDISERITQDTTKGGFTQMNTIYFNDDNGNKIVIRIDSLFNDSLPLPLLTREFAKTLKQEKLDIPFDVSHQPDTADAAEENFLPDLPFSAASGFKMQLGNSFPYLVKKITLPILFSVFLVGITLLSFILLYRSLLRQHRLALIKNDLISNITHELKTPIATVGVAIEALKNFNAIQDPQKTKEYLDISQNELQRLGLLVDKVLKLSMFENRKMEMKKEFFDLESVVNEVTASLRLQMEKYNARIIVNSEGDTTIQGDRLHLLSVVFNLLDNALKYSKGNAAIQVEIKEQPENVLLKITDNGIGIPAQYKDKIFEKFFRVPAGDTHNAKGHGLGLSYVAQVVRQHQGTIGLDSHEGLGSTFTIVLPKQST